MKPLRPLTPNPYFMYPSTLAHLRQVAAKMKADREAKRAAVWEATK